jgi:hypothetical protein
VILQNAAGARAQFEAAIAPALAAIEDVKTGTIGPMVDNATTMIGDLVEQANGLLEPASRVRPLVNSVVYAVCGVFAATSVVYFFVYFCNCCLARCLVTLFPLFALLFTLVIILPGVLFAATFYPLYDICPTAETQIDGYETGYVRDGGKLSDLLVCSQEHSLLSVLDVGFDPNVIFDDIEDMLASNVNGAGWDMGGLDDILADFGENFNLSEELSSSVIHFKYDTLLPSIPHATAGAMQAFIEAQDAERLVSIREDFEDVLGFGTRVVGRVNHTLTIVKELVNATVALVRENMNDGLDGLTCVPVKCLWSPVKNLLCANFLSGAAFWVLSTMCLIVGIVWLEMSLCLRRRSMVHPKVYPEDEGSPSEEMDELDADIKESQVRKQKLRNRKKKRAKQHESD